MVTKIIWSAGHSKRDAGVIHKGHKESDITMEIRDEVKKLRPNDLYIPDHLNLKESIRWVNDHLTDNTMAIEIHLNSHNNQNIRGAEAYYAKNPEMAQVFAREVALAQNIPNRGAKHDSEAYVGSLGWLRYTKCPSVLVEACYLTNKEDLAQLNPSKIAKGLVNALRTQTEINVLKRAILVLIRKVEDIIRNRLK